MFIRKIGHYYHIITIITIILLLLSTNSMSDFALRKMLETCMKIDYEMGYKYI